MIFQTLKSVRSKCQKFSPFVFKDTWIVADTQFLCSGI